MKNYPAGPAAQPEQQKEEEEEVEQARLSLIAKRRLVEH